MKGTKLSNDPENGPRITSNSLLSNAVRLAYLIPRQGHCVAMQSPCQSSAGPFSLFSQSLDTLYSRAGICANQSLFCGADLFIFDRGNPKRYLFMDYWSGATTKPELPSEEKMSLLALKRWQRGYFTLFPREINSCLSNKGGIR